ncbi:MAG: Uma2 family endonuclease [Defluviitaleaceae bacterium]|nr:Uma2 family endonuclease [Defluviitaleaceae bacterium]
MQIYHKATAKRHGNILSAFNFRFMSKYFDEVLANKILFRQEEGALVYWGEKDNKPYLLDIPDIDTEVNSILINSLNYVQPDLLYFIHNPYKENAEENKVIGCPDLVVEVWSPTNDTAERNFKRQLYSTSPTTEFWQIQQHSNIVECSIGKKHLPDKNLKDVLITENGENIDLRKLSL